MSDLAPIHAALLAEFGLESILALRADAIDPWIEVAPPAIADVCGFLRDDARFRLDHLNDLCGVDYAKRETGGEPIGGPRIEVVYHLTSYDTRLRCVLKATLPRWQGGIAGEPPELPSVSHIYPIADWHERECYDLVGVRFAGHPNLTRILMPEDWTGHPLRKDYQWPEEYHGIRTQ